MAETREEADLNKVLYPPGSPEAIEEGCCCSPKENRNGEGYKIFNYEGAWLVNTDCELHWWESDFFKNHKKKKKKNK